MSRIFGTPIQIFNAEDPANSSGGSGKQESVTGRIQEALKTLKPLDGARVSLQKSLDALDGTSYEQIRKAIEAVIDTITQTEGQVVMQLTGQQLNQTQAAQAAQPTPGVPTVGQLSGRDPLP